MRGGAAYLCKSFSIATILYNGWYDFRRRRGTKITLSNRQPWITSDQMKRRRMRKRNQCVIKWDCSTLRQSPSSGSPLLVVRTIIGPEQSHPVPNSKLSSVLSQSLKQVTFCTEFVWFRAFSVIHSELSSDSEEYRKFSLKFVVIQRSSEINSQLVLNQY